MKNTEFITCALSVIAIRNNLSYELRKLGDLDVAPGAPEYDRFEEVLELPRTLNDTTLHLLHCGHEINSDGVWQVFQNEVTERLANEASHRQFVNILTDVSVAITAEQADHYMNSDWYESNYKQWRDLALDASIFMEGRGYVPPLLLSALKYLTENPLQEPTHVEGDYISEMILMSRNGLTGDSQISYEDINELVGKKYKLEEIKDDMDGDDRFWLGYEKNSSRLSERIRTMVDVINIFEDN